MKDDLAKFRNAIAEALQYEKNKEMLEQWNQSKNMVVFEEGDFSDPADIDKKTNTYRLKSGIRIKSSGVGADIDPVIIIFNPNLLANDHGFPLPLTDDCTKITCQLTNSRDELYIFGEENIMKFKEFIEKHNILSQKNKESSPSDQPKGEERHILMTGLSSAQAGLFSSKQERLRDNSGNSSTSSHSPSGSAKKPTKKGSGDNQPLLHDEERQRLSCCCNCVVL